MLHRQRQIQALHVLLELRGTIQLKGNKTCPCTGMLRERETLKEREKERERERERERENFLE